MITLLIILNVICFISLIFVINWKLRRVNGLEKQIKKQSVDINSLHRNQNTLVLTIKELYRELRKRDKSLKRQIGVPGDKKEG